MLPSSLLKASLVLVLVPALCAAQAPPGHPAAQGFIWGGQTVLRSSGMPVQRLDLFVDMEALRKVVQLPDLRGKAPGDAAFQALATGKVPHAWRGEYLADVSGGMRRTKVTAFLQTHWPGGAFDAEAPVVRRLLNHMTASKRDQGDRVEEVLSEGRVHFRIRQEPWAEYKDRNLFLAMCGGNLDLSPEAQAELKRSLAMLVVR